VITMVAPVTEKSLMLDTFINASDTGFSGLIRIYRSEEQIGVVIMRSGEIAWAVSKYQNEHLGSFLERLGQVTREQLQEVERQYLSLAKTKKFGALLEELGFLTRTQLKFFIKLHVRSALLNLLELPDVVVTTNGGDMKVDEDLTFALQEILPDFFSAVDSTEEMQMMASVEDYSFINVKSAKSRVSSLFSEFSAMPGYRYSLIADFSGQVFNAHWHDQLEKENLNFPLFWIKSLYMASIKASMGSLDFTHIESDLGVCILKMVQSSRQVFLGVMFEKECKLGVIRHKIVSNMPRFQEFIEMTAGVEVFT